MFADDKMPYIKTPNKITRKLLEFINEFGKVSGYRINTHKYLDFLDANNERSKKKLRNNPIHHHIKKCLGINLTKETKDLYSENSKTVMKKVKDDTNRKIYHILGLEESISSK